MPSKISQNLMVISTFLRDSLTFLEDPLIESCVTR